MAIKLNGTEIIINKLNGTSITEESINGTKVYPTDVPATGWQYTTPTQDFVQEFEVEMFFSNPQLEGCGFGTSNLPPASNYMVGDSIRGRLNTPSSTCPTWIYYEAIFEEEKEWVYITYYSSEPNIQNSIYAEMNGSIAEIIAYLESNYPASNYDSGTNAVVYQSNDNYWTVFEVQNA